MEDLNREQLPRTILRQTEVLRRTGLSRSTLYIKGEFPRQVSLGARAVGWVEEEVDAWIAKRMLDRPQLESGNWCSGEEDTSAIQESRSSGEAFRPKNQIVERASQITGSNGSKNRSIPDLAQLELIGTNVYVEKKTGAIWFQVLRPSPTDR